MALPFVPTNMIVQQGNNQVLVSWDLIAGATSYDVQRSTDGTSYSSVATPAGNQYLDTAVASGVLYYYKVASVNGSGTSPYTTPQTVVPSQTGKLALLEIRRQAQQRADMVGSNFITIPEWNLYINQSLYELYDLLITEFEDYYKAAPITFLTNGTDQFYDLPNGTNYSGAKPFYKLLGIDLGLNSANNAFVTLDKFQFIDRNKYIYPNTTSTIYGVFNERYRIMGDQIMFTPTPASGQPIRIWYAPRLTTLLADTDIADGVSGWLEYVIVRSAKYALDKEETDSTQLTNEILFLKKRIEESAMNRDVGQPDRISDIRQGRGEGWGNGFGWSGPSGGW